ncbi:hypothetical protein [Sedimentitalea sp.]|uniref:hypothetical protein n=1 Tax=Sedimentitalea sp. TaxID=2048915 RepID=UPI003296B3BD
MIERGSVWPLPLHLGAVLTFFLVTPYSKMAHGFYRLAALAREETVESARQGTLPTEPSARPS